MLTRPDIHGDMVAFQAEGDIWIGSLKDGSAHRVTTDSTTETNPRFSPDGKMLAFTAQ